MSALANTGNGASRERYDFSRIKTAIRIPNLIEVQRQSYNRFLQMDLLPAQRETFAKPLSWNSLSIRSEIGNASADSSKGFTICAPIAGLAGPSSV